MEDDIFSFDGDNFGFSDTSHIALASPLCVPQDPINEIELYPNFLNDSISLAGVDGDFLPLEYSVMPPEQKAQARVMMRKRVAPAPLADYNNSCVLANNYKKQKGRRRERIVQQQQQRKCSHCETTQTPQWRMGPLGPKTLCNACGVRYKSGRLLPEYRPAASPTFDGDKHSNFHKKILKKKKKGFMG